MSNIELVSKWFYGYYPAQYVAVGSDTMENAQPRVL